MKLQASSARSRIWIVDDSPVEIEILRRALADTYDVVTFTDGAAMLEALAHEPPPDVLVLDWQMPGLSGIEICHYLRGNPRTEALSILLLTSHQRSEDVVEGLAAGANDYVKKPFSGPELVARVGALIRSVRLLERVEQAEARTRAILMEIPEAIFCVDVEGKLTLVNHEAERMLELSAGSLLGRTVREVLPTLPLEPILNPSGPYTFPDIRLGSSYYAPLVSYLSGDETMHATISLRDVTAQRRAQARRLDFYSIIAHDLRSPLQAILLTTQRLLQGREGVLLSKARGLLERIEKQLHAMNALVNDFLDFARVDATGIKLSPGSIDLTALVGEAVADFVPMAEAQGVKLSWEPAQEAAYVLGDRQRLGQVLSNLLSNAIKFTPRGGSVRVKMTHQGDLIETAVHDTGRGIEADAIPSLFTRYTRLDEDGDEAKGTGLGLLIVREIVEAHGGEVGVESQQGRGSTFWIRLPKSVAPEP